MSQSDPNHPPGQGSTATPLLSLEALVCGYHRRALLPPVNAQLHAGEIWALVGRNGGGKTTLMRTLLGLLRPISGVVRHATGLQIAYVPQRLGYDLSVPTRVEDFVTDGLERGWSFLRPRAATSAHVATALADAQIGDLADHRLADLSAGQQQRAIIARALVTAPQLLVLDEPTSAMDPIGEEQILALVRAVAIRRGIAVLLASHQMATLPGIADHALLIDRELGVAREGPLSEVFASSAFHRIYGDRFSHLLTPAAAEVGDHG